MADGSVWGISSLTGYVSVGGNYYYDGNYRYIKTSNATDYYQYNGQHAWRNAPSGTAGNAITFTQAMTLFSTGNLSIGTITDSGYKLDVNGTGRFSGNLRVDGTSNGYLTLNATSTGGNESGIFFQVGGGNKWENYTANNDTALNWYSYANSTIVFKLASTGAATFSGTIITGGTTANASAQLQVDSTTKGFLPPRMTSAQRIAISSPAEGLIVVQTDGTQGLYLYIGAAWHSITML
jgi:hypothetical protein